MEWQVGQVVECDRPNHQFKQCYVIENRAGSITIFCPHQNTIICGKQENLSELGWQISPTVEPVSLTQPITENLDVLHQKLR
jgi:hypothetical protein